MKILPAQRAKVTMPSLSGLAALSMALVPAHHGSAPVVGGAEAPQGTDVPAAVQQAQIRALVAAARARADAALPLYAVRTGDNLSEIAAGHCEGHAADWTGIYAASHLHGSANLITPGEELTLDCRYDAAELSKATTGGSSTRSISANVTASVHNPRSDAFDGKHGSCGDGDGDGMDADCSVIFGRHGSATRSGGRAVVTVARASGSFGNISPSSGPGGAFGACVVARESGGNSQVMNASGHYGLYQFSASTWAAYGGSPADFGHASVAEQERVFANALAHGGQSNWSPYDGC